MCLPVADIPFLFPFCSLPFPSPHCGHLPLVPSATGAHIEGIVSYTLQGVESTKSWVRKIKLLPCSNIRGKQYFTTKTQHVQWCILTGFQGTEIFAALDPKLYSHPISRIFILFKHKTVTMYISGLNYVEMIFYCIEFVCISVETWQPPHCRSPKGQWQFRKKAEKRSKKTSYICFVI